LQIRSDGRPRSVSCPHACQIVQAACRPGGESIASLIQKRRGKKKQRVWRKEVFHFCPHPVGEAGRAAELSRLGTSPTARGSCSRRKRGFTAAFHPTVAVGSIRERPSNWGALTGPARCGHTARLRGDLGPWRGQRRSIIDSSSVRSTGIRAHRQPRRQGRAFSSDPEELDPGKAMRLAAGPTSAWSIACQSSKEMFVSAVLIGEKLFDAPMERIGGSTGLRRRRGEEVPDRLQRVFLVRADHDGGPALDPTTRLLYCVVVRPTVGPRSGSRASGRRLAGCSPRWCRRERLRSARRSEPTERRIEPALELLAIAGVFGHSRQFHPRPRTLRPITTDSTLPSPLISTARRGKRAARSDDQSPPGSGGELISVRR